MTDLGQVSDSDLLAEKEQLDLSCPNLFMAYKKQYRDPNGKAMIALAERWGKLMQAEMKKQNTPLTKQIIQKTANCIKLSEISAVAQDFIRNLLIRTWKHGGKLGVGVIHTHKLRSFARKHENELKRQNHC